jgi:hypothetical protein
VRRIVDYLQPGSKTVWPGGWHLAPPSFGPLLLLPGPKSGSATAGAAGMASAPTDSMRAKSLRLRITLLFQGPSHVDSGWTTMSAQRSSARLPMGGPGKRGSAAVTSKVWVGSHRALNLFWVRLLPERWPERSLHALESPVHGSRQHLVTLDRYGHLVPAPRKKLQRSLEDVHRRINDDPHHVHEVPVDPRHLHP